MQLIAILAGAALVGGCATAGQSDLTDFNSRFQQALPASPQFKIESLAENRHQIVVYQGSITIGERTTRVSFLSKAAYMAMEDHCKQKGRKLGDVSLRDDVDGYGYVNLLGRFICA